MAKSYNLKTEIRSALRRVWLYSPMRRDALGRARVSRGIYKCEECQTLTGPKNMDVDHVIPATPPGGINHPRDFGVLIERMLYMDPIKGLRALCKPCHKTKTYEERYGKAKKKTKKAKRKPKRVRSS